MKSKVTLAVLIVLGGLGYAGYEYYDFTTTDMPAMEAQRHELESKVNQKNQELNRLREFANNIETIKEELRELNLQLESELEHMPRSFSLSALLRKLTMLAQNSGVELSTFKPSKTEAHGAPGSFYASIGIDFNLKGTFTSALLFFDQVSRLKRIINVETIKMTGHEKSGSDIRAAGGIMAETQGSIRTYRFTE